MSSIAIIVVALIALLHVFFLVHEMLPWDKPAGLHSFGQTQEKMTASNVQAAIGLELVLLP
jgi:putative membrane protein